MSAVAAWIEDLERALRVRGRARRRIVGECREHLADLAAELGEEAAVARFGSAGELAAACDAEMATRRGLRSTALAALAVVGTGASTLALIGAGTTDAQAPMLWRVVFFLSAQVAAVVIALAVVQAVRLRRAPAATGDVLLLERRNRYAVVAAGLTMLAAGGAVPGHAAAAPLLAGPALVCLALIALLRVRRLAQRIDGTGLPLPATRMLVEPRLVAVAAGCAAFAWDLSDHGTAGSALATAGVEAVAVLLAAAVLGRRLGLRSAPAA